jgi:hypothetical protein
MKSSTPTTPKPNQAPSILLIGPPGGGKTTLSMQFPGCTFYDIDENLDGPERYARALNKNLAYFYDQVRIKDDGSIREIQDIFEYICVSLNGLHKKPECKVPVLDSLTALNETIVRKILKKQNKLDGCMEARDWQPFKSDFYFVIFSRLRALNRPSICTVHEQKVVTANPNNMMEPIIKEYEPTVQGKIGDYFGAFFTDVWRCTTEQVVGKLGEYEWKIQTMKAPQFPMLKNSFGMPATITVKKGENAFLKVNEYMKLSL